MRIAMATNIPMSAAAMPMASKAMTPPAAGETVDEAKVSRASMAALKLTSADRSIRSMFLFDISPYRPIPNMAAERDRNRYEISIIQFLSEPELLLQLML